jgi:hypothetical protein
LSPFDSEEATFSIGIQMEEQRLYLIMLGEIVLREGTTIAEVRFSDLL